MRYELSDDEWTAIKPMLPNKPRGVPRVNDRRVLNGIFWVLRSGAPWRDLPNNFGPYTTCYNRFVRWRRAGVWAKIMSALAEAHDAAVQMIDTSIVRVHQHGACMTRKTSHFRRRSMVKLNCRRAPSSRSLERPHQLRLPEALDSGIRLVRVPPGSGCTISVGASPQRRIRCFARGPFIGSSPTSNAQRNDPGDVDFATPSAAASGTCARG
jgi:transposase